MRRKRSNFAIPFRAGNAGMIASFVMAVAGVFIGAGATYLGERGAAAQAARIEAQTLFERENTPAEKAYQAREKIIRRVLTGAPPERLPTPQFTQTQAVKPKIIIVFDDMGLNKAAFDVISNLPGPLTLSFLPYANDVEMLAKMASDRGSEVMLHLPMEPQGKADPGPHALRTTMNGSEFIKELEWNLGRFSNYVGVNNHMGSKVTTNEAAMKTVLAFLENKDLFFLDSVTTGDSVVRAAGAAVGAKVFSRDVFLDADAHNAQAVFNQLMLVEKIATETGFAVAICHPYPETIAVLGPWLTSAPYRGFEIATVSSLLEGSKQNVPTLIAEALALRL